MGRNDGPNEADDPRMDVEDSTIESVLNQMISERIAAHLGLQMVREVDAAVNRARPQLWNDLVAVVKAEVKEAVPSTWVDFDLHVRKYIDERLPAMLQDALFCTPALSIAVSDFFAKYPHAAEGGRKLRSPFNPPIVNPKATPRPPATFPSVEASLGYIQTVEQRKATASLKFQLRRIALELATQETHLLSCPDQPRAERARFNLATLCDLLKTL